MFHEVKIFDKKGKVKKVISGKNLSSEYWNSFFNNPLSDSKKKGIGRRNKPQNNTDCDDESLELSGWLQPLSSGNGVYRYILG